MGTRVHAPAPSLCAQASATSGRGSRSCPSLTRHGSSPPSRRATLQPTCNRPATTPCVRSGSPTRDRLQPHVCMRVELPHLAPWHPGWHVARDRCRRWRRASRRRRPRATCRAARKPTVLPTCGRPSTICRCLPTASSKHSRCRGGPCAVPRAMHHAPCAMRCVMRCVMRGGMCHALCAMRCVVPRVMRGGMCLATQHATRCVVCRARRPRCSVHTHAHASGCSPSSPGLPPHVPGDRAAPAALGAWLQHARPQGGAGEPATGGCGQRGHSVTLCSNPLQ